MKKYDPILYDVAITLIPKIGAKSVIVLLEHFSSTEQILNFDFNSLTLFPFSTQIRHRIEQYRDNSISQANAIIKHCSVNNIKIIAKHSHEYPELLREIPDPPHVIYVRGTLPKTEHYISVVGTRKCSNIGVAICQKTIQEIKKHIPNTTIVSGLAFGIDKIAHSESLAQGIPTIAVLPGWVDDITPPSHYYIARQIIEQKGALISEMPPSTIINRGNYLCRNRIIAALSQLTIVVESKKIGGSMSTANTAFGYNREVFAPIGDGSLNFEGNISLIKSNKAFVLQSFDDLLSEMNWGSSKPKIEVERFPMQLIESFDLLPNDNFTLEEASEILNLNIPQASQRLSVLEINGLISTIHGGVYMKNQIA